MAPTILARADTQPSPEEAPIADVPNLPQITEDAARLWVNAQDVTIHFNEMILNFLLKAIGAVTVGAGLFGTILLTKENLAAPGITYMIYAGAMALFGAAAVLEVRYAPPR